MMPEIKNVVKYSIITPINNTEKSLFYRCFMSVIDICDNYIGIEWIIILHNCNMDYIKYITNLINGYDFIKVYILNNDIKSPSIPRNEGIRKANGEYILFLDSDDELKSECFESRDSNYENAEVIIYNAKTVKENDKLTPVDLPLLYDKSSIVVDDSNKKLLLYGLGRQVWAKKYNLKFLLKNNIFFDENIIVGEDVVFNAKCYVKAKKILVDPNIYAYIYHQNGKSLLQSIDINREIDYNLYFTRYVDEVASVVGKKFDLSLFYIEVLSFTAMLLFNKNVNMSLRKKIYDTIKVYVSNINFDNLIDEDTVNNKVRFINMIYKR